MLAKHKVYRSNSLLGQRVQMDDLKVQKVECTTCNSKGSIPCTQDYLCTLGVTAWCSQCNEHFDVQGLLQDSGVPYCQSHASFTQSCTSCVKLFCIWAETQRPNCGRCRDNSKVEVYDCTVCEGTGWHECDADDCPFIAQD